MPTIHAPRHAENTKGDGRGGASPERELRREAPVTQNGEGATEGGRKEGKAGEGDG